MPFSFKPEVSQTAAPGTTPAAPKASFVDASAATPTNMMAREGSHRRGMIQTTLFIACVGSILIAIGLFAYSSYLNSQVDAKKATLASYESRLGSLPLEDMRRLSNRINIINQLIQQHPSTNVAFRIIEDSVENQVTYKGFELRYNDQGKNYFLQLRAVAPDYKSVAQQIDTFNRKPYTTYIQNVSVEGLQLDDTGKVGFTLKMPIAITGLLPENINLSAGASERIGLSTSTPTTTSAMNNTASTSTTSTFGNALPPKATSTAQIGVSGPTKSTLIPKATSTLPLR